MARVRVEVPVHPTESVAKVKQAVRNVFPDVAFQREEGTSLVGEAAAFDRLRELVRNQKIRDAARAVLLRARRGNTTSFELNKQAAFAGRVNFAAPSPLGGIRVVIEDDNLDAVIDYVAESTVVRRPTAPRGRTGGT